MSEIRSCFTPSLPESMALISLKHSIEENSLNHPTINSPNVEIKPAQLAAMAGKTWEPGRTLTFRYLPGSTLNQRRDFQKYIEPWLENANLRFRFMTSGSGEIRVSFHQGQGSWSYIGTDALSIPQSQPTINIGWHDFDGSTSLHECGHILGCPHDQQLPDTKIPWNRQAVYKYYQGPPNYWPKSMIDQNVLDPIPANQLHMYRWDKDGIMQYPVPEELTIGNFSIGWNSKLSPGDREMIAKIYPGARPPSELKLEVNGPSITGNVSSDTSGNHDLIVNQKGRLLIITERNPLVIIILKVSENGKLDMLAWDNDGNAEALVQSGNYKILVQAAHLNQSMMNYQIAARMLKSTFPLVS